MSKTNNIYYAVVGLAAFLTTVFVIHKLKNKGNSKAKKFRKNLVSIAEKEHADWNFGKKKETSKFAFSRLSEPWTEFASILSANSFLIVPISASSGLVAPMTYLLSFTAFSPRKT